MQKNIKITYLKKANKFLIKNSDIISESDIDKLMILAIKKRVYLQNINLDIKYLKGILKGKYRVSKGNIRIIFEIRNYEILIETIIEDIDYRGSIYKKR